MSTLVLQIQAGIPIPDAGDQVAERTGDVLTATHNSGVVGRSQPVDSEAGGRHVVGGEETLELLVSG